jgi:hypothetical protein
MCGRNFVNNIKHQERGKKFQIFLNIFALTFLLGISKTMAQESSVGFRAGINRSNWATTAHRGASELKSQNSLNMGILLVIGLPDQNSLQTELNYSRHKAMTVVKEKNNQSYIKPGSYGIFTLSYLETPFMVRFEFGERIKFFGSLGVNASFLLNVSQESQTTFQTPAFDIEIADKDLIRRKDFDNIRLGVIFGFGMDIDLGEQHLIIDLKNTRGFTDLVNGTDLNFRTDTISTLWMNSLTLSIGYTFELD